jgi:diguanylate cyclase (GGDEF)-like protein
MASSSQVRLPTPDIPGGLAADIAVTVDRRARQLRMMLRAVAVTSATVATLEIAAGFGFREPRAVGLGLAAFGYAGLVLYLTTAIGSIGRDRVVAWIAALTLGLLAMGTLVEPSLAPAMAIAALLPGVLVLPFLGSRSVNRTLLVAGIVGIGSVVAGQVLPPGDRLPSEVTRSIAFLTLCLSYIFLLVFLWEVSRRLKTTADDLRGIVAMSNDLAQTMDPQLVGDRIARHIGQAIGADDCAICYWDRPTDRLVTLGYYPPERRSAVEPTYALADYPATRLVMEESRPTIVDTGDPAADPNELAYLASIGQQSMAIIPLVAAGTMIGALEMTSKRRGAFSPRDIEMASMLASEAAMALENARLYDAIRHQALHDGLTGLANRALFRERVVRALERSRGTAGRPFAILFIDLDDFKRLNDTLGHARGDDVLVAAARRVEESLRPSDMAARLGGDEFAVLLDDVGDDELALSIAIRLADALREPIELGDASPAIAASIGVALSGNDLGETADDLLRNADVAMYAAKGSSRGRAEVFRSTYRVEAAARSELAGQLRGVAQRGELRLDYQPIVELVGGAVVGVEALVRWQPPDRPLLMPGQFIDLAEETGDIVPMGQWILREACRQLREWQLRLGLPQLQVSVNLSARQFREHDLVESVRAILVETELPPASLILEITESGLMQRTDVTISTLAELRTLGAHLAIDDFGTGYSSLSYLERFPVDSLKIDRSFIAGMSASGDRPAIARAIVELGRTLGLKVVAEGIEEPDQAAWLVSLGCPLGQGYLFSRPLGVDAMEAYLAADATRRVQERGPDTDETVGPGVRKTARRATAPLRLVSGE